MAALFCSLEESVALQSKRAFNVLLGLGCNFVCSSLSCCSEFTYLFIHLSNKYLRILKIGDVLAAKEFQIKTNAKCFFVHSFFFFLLFAIPNIVMALNILTGGCSSTTWHKPTLAIFSFFPSSHGICFFSIFSPPAASFDPQMY